MTSGEQPKQLQEPSVTFTGGFWHFDQVLSDTELEDGIIFAIPPDVTSAMFVA